MKTRVEQMLCFTILQLTTGAGATFSYFTAVPYFSQSSQIASQLTVISDCSVIHAVNFE